MRTLLIGVLVATLAGCSSCPPLPRQLSMQGCTDANGFACFDRTSTDQTFDQELSSARANSTAAKPKTAAKTEKRAAAHPRAKPLPEAKKSEPSEKTEPAVANAKVEPPPSDQPSGTSDPVIANAKTAIAARLENPTSAEFGDMKRAMRKNTLGQSVDTICGRVKGRTATGEDTGDRPFLYLVKDNEAYVVDGAPSSVAATAYRNICN
jgi:hypothetical protein